MTQELPLPNDDSSAASTTVSVRQQQQAARQFFDQWQQQSTQLEAQLVGQLQGLAEQVEAAQQCDVSTGPDPEIAKQLEELQALRNDLAQQQDEWSQSQLQASEQQQQLLQQLNQQFGKLQQQQSDLEQRRQELEQIANDDDAALQQQMMQFQEELIRLREQSAQRTGQVEQLKQDLTHAREKLASREDQLHEVTRQLEELSATGNQSSTEAARRASELTEARDEAVSQLEAAQVALSQARSDQAELREELSQNRQQMQAYEQRIEQLQEQAIAAIDDQQQQSTEQLASLGQLCEQLQGELAAAQAELQAQPTNEAPDADSLEELQEWKHRYQEAQADLVELRGRNELLQSELESAQQNPAASSGPGSGMPVPAGDGALDWESQKRKLLAQLEEEDDDDDDEFSQRRLSIEGTIRMTDQVVNEKDQEIAELRRLLEDQSTNLNGVAIGAQAIAEMLDDDELIRQEREKLEAAQEEWREKLRKAEIDISVERAKIARERNELEERIRDIEAAGSKISNSQGNSQSTSDKPKRGRWLSRLGLKDGEQE